MRLVVLLTALIPSALSAEVFLQADLFKLCTQAETKPYCYGYINGHLEGIFFRDVMTSMELEKAGLDAANTALNRQFCLPVGLSNEQLAELVTQWIRNNGGSPKTPAVLAVKEALRSHHPCVRK